MGSHLDPQVVDVLKVPADALRRACETLQPVPGDAKDRAGDAPFLGQQRAIEALRFGIDIERPGYNVFVLGPLGSQRHGLVDEMVSERAAGKSAPDDWCYVNNFESPDKPIALRLPKGMATRLRQDMTHAVEDLLGILPAVTSVRRHSRPTAPVAFLEGSRRRFRLAAPWLRAPQVMDILWVSHRSRSLPGRVA